MFYAIAAISALAGLAFAVHLCIKWYNMPKVEREKTAQDKEKYDAQDEKRDDRADRRRERQGRKNQ